MSARKLLLILAGLAIAGAALVYYHAGRNPPAIDPHAAEELKKAKQR